MMAALAANSARLEEEARQKRKAANMGAAIQKNQEIQRILQKREEEVAAYLEKVGLEKIKTDADGNCFFYAVQGYADIKGKEDMSVSVEALRNAVAETIQIKKDEYLLSFVSNNALQAHVDNIRKCEERGDTTNTWADEVDVAAFSDYFKVCIVVHDWHETNNFPYHMKKLTYQDKCDEKQDNIIIHILRTNNNHYSLLMPVDDPQYKAVKLLIDDLSLPLNQFVSGAHKSQLKQMAHAASNNLSRIRLNQAGRSSASQLPGASAATAIALNGVRGKSEAAASSSSNVLDEEYIDKLLKQISKLQEDINITSKRKRTPAIETYLIEASRQLEKRLEIAKQLGRGLGGTRKHKKLRRTHQRRTRQKRNKNKSRRRL